MPFPNPDTQFKPGNPGRPRGRGIAAKLREYLERSEINGKPIKDGRTIGDMIADRIVAEALSGNFRFVELLVDRVDGKLGAGETSGSRAGSDVEALREFLSASEPAKGRRKARRVLGGDAGPEPGVSGPRDPA